MSLAIGLLIPEAGLTDTLVQDIARKDSMSGMEWSVFAAAVVVVGILVGAIMHLMERKKPKYMD